MVDSLKEYGYDFQVKVMAGMMSDRQFTGRMLELLEESMIDSDSLRFVLNSIKSYYREYKMIPTLDVFKIQLANVKSPELKESIKGSIKDIWKNLQSNDLPFVKSTVTEFCINQAMKQAIVSSVDLLKEGNYDSIKKLVTDALKKGLDDNIGHNYLEEVDFRYSEQAEPRRISTGWEVIDHITGGGIPEGKLCIWIAGPGGSKSFHLVHLGAVALKLGYNVLHYTLELDENYVSKRYDACLTEIDINDLKYHVPKIKSRLSTIEKGSLVVKFFPAKSISLDGLKSHAERTIMVSEKKPDMIIIDYADLLKLRSHQTMRKDELLQELYEEMRGWAGELNIPIHSASQINRCLKFDTNVNVLDKGDIQLKSVSEGDMIMTHVGYRKVTKVYKSTVQPVYRIKLKSGHVIECSSLHDFPTSHGKLKSLETGLNIGDKLFIKK